MNFVFQKAFEKDFKKLSLKQKEKFNERLKTFEQDQFKPILNNHALIGKYSGCRSVNVTGDLRAIYKKVKNDIIFVAIGSHSHLYG